MLLGGNCPGEGDYPGGNYPRWELSRGNYPGGNYPWWELSGGGDYPGGQLSRGNCPVTILK